MEYGISSITFRARRPFHAARLQAALARATASLSAGRGFGDGGGGGSSGDDLAPLEAVVSPSFPRLHLILKENAARF